MKFEIIQLDGDTEQFWERFAGRWDSCGRCKLSKTRANVVHGRGTLPADILFIGEGPGKDEDREGFPFVGVSGRILNQMIQDAKLEERGFTYFISNLVGCRPTDRPNGPNRPPTPYEIKQCSGHLSAVIDFVKPAVVIALGKVTKEVVEPLILERNNAERRYGDGEDDLPIGYLGLVHPSFIARSGGVKSTPYQRTLEKLTAYFERVQV